MRSLSVAAAMLGLGITPFQVAHSQQDAASACKLSKIGTMPVTANRFNRVVTKAGVDGTAANFLIDTGSPITVMNPPPDGERHAGIYDGTFRLLENIVAASVYLGKVSDLSIGDYHAKDVTFPYSAQRLVTGDYYGVLGGDVLGTTDLEMDLNGGSINLFGPNTCGENAIYWADKFSEVQLAHVNKQIIVFVELNGTPTRAVLDTGSAQSWISWELAHRVGIETNSPGVIEDKPGNSDRQAGKTEHYRFSELKIGDEVAKNVSLGIKQFRSPIFWGMPADNYLDVNMILGVDFLRNHRLYVDRTTEKVYFTWNGKTLFTPPQSD